MRKRNKWGVFFVFVISTSLFFGRDFIANYYQDHFKYGDNSFSESPLTAVEEARSVVRDAFMIVSIISRCKKFPVKHEDIFNKKIFSSDLYQECSHIDPNPPGVKEQNFTNVRPIWIDPWRRPYQIRYNRERRILQVRSQGRYLGTELDDIVGETTWGMAGSIFNDEIKRCDSLPKNDMSCIFNRGWH